MHPWLSGLFAFAWILPCDFHLKVDKQTSSSFPSIVSFRPSSMIYFCEGEMPFSFFIAIEDK